MNIIPIIFSIPKNPMNQPIGSVSGKFCIRLSNKRTNDLHISDVGLHVPDIDTYLLGASTFRERCLKSNIMAMDAIAVKIIQHNIICTLIFGLNINDNISIYKTINTTYFNNKLKN